MTYISNDKIGNYDLPCSRYSRYDYTFICLSSSTNRFKAGGVTARCQPVRTKFQVLTTVLPTVNFSKLMKKKKIIHTQVLQ